MSGTSTYVPKSRVAKWFEARLPIVGLVHGSFIAYPVPRNLNYFWTFGAILSAFLGIQIITGVWLAMHYEPSATGAFNSVEHIMRDVNYGWLLRYAHANGASMFFVAVYVHMFRALYYGSYKAPREVLYILGVVIYLLMMATAFLGYTLPWGQMSFWGATVITNILAAIPVVGDTIQTPALGRVFRRQPDREPVLLAALPAAVDDRRRRGAARLGAPHHRAEQPGRHPDQVGQGFGAVHALRDDQGRVRDRRVHDPVRVVPVLPAELPRSRRQLHPGNPAVTPAHIVPEWYFLPFYAILRAVPDKLGGVILMFSAVIILAFAPWLDTSRIRSCNYRPIYRQFLWVFVGVTLLLGWLGSQPPEGGYVIASQLCTAYYFAHFLLVMPLVRPVRDAEGAAGFDPGERHRTGQAGERIGHAGWRGRRTDDQGLTGVEERQ